MEKYATYTLEDFMLDDAFRKWVNAGGVLRGSVWEQVVHLYPEKIELIDEAALLLRQLKNQPTAISDEQVMRDIRAIMHHVEGKETVVRPMWRRWTGYAAAAVLLAGLGTYLLTGQTGRVGEEISYFNDSQDLKYVNSGRDQKEVTLPDGSMVRLLPGSEVIYRSQPAGRDVQLAGEAFFQVKRDTLRPFSVFSGGLTTRVLGTSFTIKPEGKDVSVTVATGKVSVSKAGEESSPLVLMPNQRAVYHNADKKIVKTLAEAPVVVNREQLQTRLVFDEEPAGNIFRALQKAYNIPISFDEAALRNCQVTLPFREEPFFQKLDVLCRTIGAKYTVTGGGVRIESNGCE